MRREIKNDFTRVFAFPDPLVDKVEEKTVPDDHVDVLITPSTLSPAPELSDVLNKRSPIDSYVNDVLTVPASLAGIPAMSVPVRVGDDVVGVQVMGQFGDEDMVLDVGEMLEGLLL